MAFFFFFWSLTPKTTRIAWRGERGTGLELAWPPISCVILCDSLILFYSPTPLLESEVVGLKQYLSNLESKATLLSNKILWRVSIPRMEKQSHSIWSRSTEGLLVFSWSFKFSPQISYQNFPGIQFEEHWKRWSPEPILPLIASTLATQSTVLWAAEVPGSVLGIQHFGPPWDLLNQNLHLKKIPRWFIQVREALLYHSETQRARWRKDQWDIFHSCMGAWSTGAGAFLKILMLQAH